MIMTNMQSIIARIDRWLAANRPDYYGQLQAGVTDAELLAFEARFSLTLPEAFKQLYGWRNGQDALCFDSFQTNRMLLSLDDVAETKDMFDGMIGTDFDDPRYWRRAWVPFLSNGGGSYLCLDLAAEDGGKPGQLIAFWKSDEDRPIEFESMEAWLVELVTSMENGSLELV
jgi:cell wall assembly regulator SMI1